MVICYSSLRRPSRFNAIKAAVGDRCHIEKAKGNDIQNKEYCSKEGQFTEWEPLWGRDVEAISSKLYNLCRAERLQWSGSPESARFKLSNITRELRLIFASHDPSQNETLKRKLDSTMDVPDRARVEERSQRLKLLEDEYTTSLAEIGGMDTNSMSASSSMTLWMDKI